MIGANKANTLFIQKAQKNKDFNDTIFCNISFGDASEMIKDLGDDNQNILFSQIVPNYQDKSLPIIQEYHTLTKQYDPNFEASFISLEAFLSAKLLVTALKNIQGDITRKKFLHQLRSLPKETLKGIQIDTKNENFLHKVYLFTYKNKHFREIQR